MPKKKLKISPEDQLELTGNESVEDLYNVYIRHYTSNSKLTNVAREVWKRAYKENKNGKH